MTKNMIVDSVDELMMWDTLFTGKTINEVISLLQVLPQEAVLDSIDGGGFFATLEREETDEEYEKRIAADELAEKIQQELAARRQTEVASQKKIREMSEELEKLRRGLA